MPFIIINVFGPVSIPGNINRLAISVLKALTRDGRSINSLIDHSKVPGHRPKLFRGASQTISSM